VTLSLLAPWARAFAWTVIVETAVVLPLLRFACPSRLRRAGLVLLANVVSHPLLWFLFARLTVPFGHKTLWLEGWAWLAELIVYRISLPKLTLARAAAISAVANGLSWGLGVVVRELFGVV